MAFDANCRACGAARRFPLLDGWFQFNDSLHCPTPVLELVPDDDPDDDPVNDLVDDLVGDLADDLVEPTPEEAAAWAEALEICLRAERAHRVT